MIYMSIKISLCNGGDFNPFTVFKNFVECDTGTNEFRPKHQDNTTEV
jgi:hypothetical protein